MIFKAIVLTLTWLAMPIQAEDRFFGTVTHVPDGDTLWVRPDGRAGPRRLRIDGIDAPEICQEHGQTARAALMRRALNRRVGVTVRRYDDYGRGLARIELGNQDLGAELVRTGQAWSYRWRQQPGPYAVEESIARQARLGLFAAMQPELPRDFRKRHGPCRVSGQ